MKSEKPKSITDYIAGLPSKAQKHLQQIRALIKKLVPEAEETISYGMPAFKAPDQKNHSFPPAGKCE